MNVKKNMTFAVLLLIVSVAWPVQIAHPQETDDNDPGTLSVASYFPEKTVFMTVLPDTPDLKEKITSHRLAEAVRNEQIRAFFRPLLEKKSLKKFLQSIRTVTGHSLDQLTDMFTGPVAAGLLEGKKGLFAENPENDPAAQVQGVLIGQIDGHEQAVSEEIIPSLVEKWKKTLQKEGDEELFEKTEPMENGTLHTYLKRSKDETKEVFSWTIANGYLVAVSPKSQTLLRNTVRRITGDLDGSSVKQVDNFRSALRNTEKVEGYMYSNLKRIIAAGYDRARESYRKNKNKQGPSPEDVWRVLGLDTFRNAVGTVNLEPSFTEFNVEVAYTERTGISELLAFRPLAPDRDQLLSLPSSVVSGTAWGFSLKTFWKRGMATMKELSSRMAMMLNMQLKQLKSSYGVDLNKDIINALGDRIIAVNVPPSEDTDSDDDEKQLDNTRQLWAIQVNDTDRLKSALKSIKDGIEKGKKYFSTRKYLGTTIYSVNKDMMPSMIGGLLSPSYAFVDGYVILSMHETVIEDSIAHLNRDGEQGFFEKKDVRRAFDRLPDEAVSLGYTNLKTLLSFFVENLTSMNAVPWSDDIKKYVDLETRLSPEVIGKYIQSVVGGMYVNDQRMRGIWRLQHAK